MEQTLFSPSLAKLSFAVRRTAPLWVGYVAVLCFAVPVLSGAFLSASNSYGIWHALYGVFFLGVFGARLTARFKDEDQRRNQRLWVETSSQRHSLRMPGSDLELSLLLLVAVHAMVQMKGGLGSSLHALVYVLVAIVAAFSERRVGVTLVLSALGMETLVYFYTERNTELRPFALYVVFLSFFALTNWLFTRVEITKVRERSKQELDAAKTRDREDARMFRLIAAPVSTHERDEDRMFRSSVEEVHQALFHTLLLLRQTLELHTCVLLMLDDSGKELRIAELSSASDNIQQQPLRTGEGVVGAVLDQKELMNLAHLRPGYKGLCYYRNGAEVRAFVGVPVMENNQVRGVLCADRIEDRPFTVQEQSILQNAVQHIVRTVQNERVFVQLERSKYEQTVLHKASQALGSALSEEGVLDAVFESAHLIAAYDLCVVTAYDAQQRKHRVTRAVGIGSEQLEGLSFTDNTSLTAMVVKTGHYLPYRGDFDDKQQVVYTKRIKLPGMRSLLVLPLTVQDKTIGTLALATARRGAFPDSLRTTLRVLANQLAVALSNAASVKRLRELATTDGLTGCLNKRAFMLAMERKVRAAERFGRKLSLVITDLDHFKNINDTYGHATGDKVIQRLGAILLAIKRDTDVVARFGGEEFCLLCEETDTPGAVLLAERLREEIGATPFETENGKLTVTCSLGVATYPRDAQDKEGLFSAADRALYAAKHSGRNRVCTVGPPTS